MGFKFNNKHVLSTFSIFVLLCWIAGLPAQAKEKCDTKTVEITKGEKTVWSGATVDVFNKYPHGVIGSGNRPERAVVRISSLIKELNIAKTAQVTIIACRNKSMQLAVADIISGDIDIWLTGLRNDEIRVFEIKKGREKPKKKFKRIISVHFTE